MGAILDLLSSVPDLLLVVLGFSAIIIIHEAGHFFAARWAGIRVLAFAVGFGPALFSYRKGLGWRKGSSEPEYNKLIKGEKTGINPVDVSAISPTEYRLNCLPFGGYVKMLGQDDADPTAKSDEPDSYQNCPPWKRMVVISAGVTFNIITAAILFILVFNPAVGLESEPAKIGNVPDADRPAYAAVATNATELGVTEPGLRPGDTILSINGDVPHHFNDISTMVAMAHKDEPLQIDVQRPNVQGILHFAITPDRDPESKLLSIGVSPMATTKLVKPRNKRTREELERRFVDLGYPGLEPGMRLVQINGQPVTTPYNLDAAVDLSNGDPIVAVFQADPVGGAPGKRVSVTVVPKPKLKSDSFKPNPETSFQFQHLFGLTPLLAIRSVETGKPAAEAGLKAGDIFARIGEVEWPSIPTGIQEIRKHKDKPLSVTVLRKNEKGELEQKEFANLRPNKEGILGFSFGDSTAFTNHVAMWPVSTAGGGHPTPSGGSIAELRGGSRITAVNGQSVATLAELRNQLKSIIAAQPDAAITLDVQLPVGGDASASKPEKVAWAMTKEERSALARLGWEANLDSTVFEPEKFVWKSDTVLGAIPMGLHETRRVMLTTYLTFARLFQGSVQVQHLKGPIGIAHIGVTVADRGYVWLLFFMALISVNLAVINFLPMPIADGGHMVFLIYEQFSGKPPSARVQNAAAIVGLVLIGTMLLVVTFNDISGVLENIRRFFK
jgi:regulator of sigma E protease